MRTKEFIKELCVKMHDLTKDDMFTFPCICSGADHGFDSLNKEQAERLLEVVEEFKDYIRLGD